MRGKIPSFACTGLHITTPLLLALLAALLQMPVCAAQPVRAGRLGEEPPAKKIAEQGHACYSDPEIGVTTCWNKAGKSIAEFDGSLESLKLDPALAAKLQTHYRTYCAKEVPVKTTAKRNPFVDFGLAKPSTAICLNIDGRIQFWREGDVRISVEFFHAIGNYRNESWKLRVEPQTDKVLQIQKWPMLRCVAYQSKPPPATDGAPRVHELWAFSLQRDKMALQLGASWSASPIAEPPKYDAATFRKHISGGVCVAEKAEVGDTKPRAAKP